MMNPCIFYIVKDGSTSEIFGMDSYHEIFNISAKNYLNNICLNMMTTLEGRVAAIKQNFNIIKNVPIFITQDLVLFTMNDYKATYNIFINCVYIKQIEENIDGCTIIFYDNSQLKLEKKYQFINNKYEKCIKIIKKINQYC